MEKKKKKLLPSSSIVSQSNKLVSSRYTLPMSEQRLVLTMIAKIQPEDEDFKPYKISVKDLAEFLGIDKSSAYRECKKITKSLLSRVLELNETGRVLQTHWVSSADYLAGTGMVNLSFDPLLKPYLLQLKGNFTSCKLEMLLSFKSQYTMRIYTILKQYEKLKTREIEIDELREMLGLRKDQHVEYSNFKNNILKSTQKELSEKADIYFEYDEIKYGRKVGALKFYIIKSNFQAVSPEGLGNIDDSDLIENNDNSDNRLGNLILLVPDVYNEMKKVKSEIEKYLLIEGFDYVKRNILYSNEMNPRSYVGYLSNALKEDWGHDWEIENIAKNKKKPIEIWKRQGFSSEHDYDEFMYKKQMDNYSRSIN